MPEDKNKKPEFHEIHGAHEEEVRRVLAKMKHESEEQQSAAFAAVLSLPYIDLNIFPIDPETLRTLKKEDAQKYSVVCLQRAGKNVSLASPNPESPQLQEFFEKLKRTRDSQSSLLSVPGAVFKNQSKNTNTSRSLRALRNCASL